MTIALMSLSGSGFSIFKESAKKRAFTSNNRPTMLLAVGSVSSSAAKVSKPDSGETCVKSCFLYFQTVEILRHKALLGIY